MTLGIGDREFTGLVAVLDDELAARLCEDRLAFRLAGFEELGDAREAVSDVLARNSTRVERAHGELRTRLADRLRGDDAYRGADVDRTAARKIPAVAGLADTVLGVTRHDRATHDRLDA